MAARLKQAVLCHCSADCDFASCVVQTAATVGICCSHLCMVCQTAASASTV